MSFHKDWTGLDIHVPHRWTYADATARNAAGGFVTADLLTLAIQLDNYTLWILTATTPVWIQVPGSGSAGTPSGHETPGGTVNGSNVTFTLAHTPLEPTNALLFQDGVFLSDTDDYTLSGTTITFAAAPPTGSRLQAIYRY